MSERPNTSQAQKSIAIANTNAQIPDNPASFADCFILGGTFVLACLHLMFAIGAFDVMEPVQEKSNCQRYANAKQDGKHPANHGKIVLQ
jgi:hypothetical protein